MGATGRSAATKKGRETLGATGRSEVRRKANETLGAAGRSDAAKKREEARGAAGRSASAKKREEARRAAKDPHPGSHDALDRYLRTRLGSPAVKKADLRPVLAKWQREASVQLDRETIDKTLRAAMQRWRWWAAQKAQQQQQQQQQAEREEESEESEESVEESEEVLWKTSSWVVPTLRALPVPTLPDKSRSWPTAPSQSAA